MPHRYILAEGPGVLYVAFIGTKVLKDLVADVNIFQSPLWEAAPELAHLPREERRSRRHEARQQGLLPGCAPSPLIGCTRLAGGICSRSLRGSGLLDWQTLH